MVVSEEILHAFLHDVRTPLNVVLDATALLAEETASVAEERPAVEGQLSSMITRNARTIEGLVATMSALSGAHGLHPSDTWAQVAETVEGCVLESAPDDAAVPGGAASILKALTLLWPSGVCVRVTPQFVTFGPRGSDALLEDDDWSSFRRRTRPSLVVQVLTDWAASIGGAWTISSGHLRLSMPASPSSP